MKVITVDCNYVGPEFACSYLLVEDGRGFFIECNTNHAIPYLVAAAKKEGIEPENIDGLIVTHVHLDHAGGTGLFLKTFPNAIVYAHPKAARHLIDPSKLIASATQVYGVENMKKFYGDILPAPKERVHSLEDGAQVSWNVTQQKNIVLKTKHTRGHANHHLCVVLDEGLLTTIFSGDSFGVAYPAVNQKREDKNCLVITVSTSPTDFDETAALETVEWIEQVHLQAQERAQEGARVGLTHFGFIGPKAIPQAAQMLKDQIRFSGALLAKIKRDSLTVEQTQEHIKDWTLQYYAQKGIHLDEPDLKLLGFDFKINAQGLHYRAHANG